MKTAGDKRRVKKVVFYLAKKQAGFFFMRYLVNKKDTLMNG